MFLNSQEKIIQNKILLEVTQRKSEEKTESFKTEETELFCKTRKANRKRRKIHKPSDKLTININKSVSF